MSSRVAKNPIKIPTGVDINIHGQKITVKGKRGELHWTMDKTIGASKEDNVLQFLVVKMSKGSEAIAGTTRALVQNMVIGVTEGFKKELQLKGVGYRAQVQGKVLNLTLGFSHPVNVKIPTGITIEVPEQTVVVITGVDKQQVGQLAANIRAIRPPEPYKGKGIRYADETIILKEVKKQQ